MAPKDIRHPHAMDGVVSAKRPDGASFADPWLFGGIHPIVGIGPVVASWDAFHPTPTMGEMRRRHPDDTLQAASWSFAGAPLGPSRAEGFGNPWRARALAVWLVIGFLVLFVPFSVQAFSGSEPGDRELSRIYGMLQANPRDVSLWNAYGIELAKTGNVAGAIQVWRRGLDVDSRYVHLYNNIGSALRRLGFLKEAVEWYQISLRLQQTYWTWYNLGLLYLDLKKRPEAAQAFQSALTLCPTFALARDNLMQLQREMEVPVDRTQARLQPALPILPSPVPNPQSRQVLETALTHKTLPTPAMTAVEPPLQHVPLERQPKKTKPQPVQSLEKPAPPIRTTQDVGGAVFFTFDGGAEADGIPAILQALQQRGVRSTFFLTGHWVENYPDLAIQILAAGHEIANHSMSHPHMGSWDKSKIAQELAKAEAVFQRVLGRSAIKYFRFPFGEQNARVEKIVEELGYHHVYWDIDTLDWAEPSSSSIITKVRTKLKPRAVILMHCGSKSGSRILHVLLDEVLARGYSPISLSSYDPLQIAAITSR